MGVVSFFAANPGQVVSLQVPATFQSLLERQKICNFPTAFLVHPIFHSNYVRRTSLVRLLVLYAYKMRQQQGNSFVGVS